MEFWGIQQIRDQRLWTVEQAIARSALQCSKHYPWEDDVGSKTEESQVEECCLIVKIWAISSNSRIFQN